MAKLLPLESLRPAELPQDPRLKSRSLLDSSQASLLLEGSEDDGLQLCGAHRDLKETKTTKRRRLNDAFRCF